MEDKSFWQDRPTYVTGATGLVGGWVVRRLVDLGADVTCLVRDWEPRCELVQAGLLDRVKLIRGDVSDQVLQERTLGEDEIDTVIHLAAQTIVGVANRNPVSTFTSNIQGTWALLEACRRSPSVKSIVLASSDKAYGDNGDAAYDETTALRGVHPYDVSKSCSDLIAQAYAKTYNLPVCVTRCGNFYGGGDLNWNRIVPGTIRSVIRGQRPVIRSDGQYVRDYFYVEDGVEAYLLLARKLIEQPALAGEAFNFSDEHPLTVIEIADRVLRLMGSDLRPEIRNEATHEIRVQRLAAGKARRVLDWRPLFELDDGLRRTIDWYRNHFEAAA